MLRQETPTSLSTVRKVEIHTLLPYTNTSLMDNIHSAEMMLKHTEALSAALY